MDTTQKSTGDFWITLGSPLLTNTGGRPIPTDAQLMLEYLTNDLVYTCANCNAASVARVQFRLYARRRAGEKAVVSHPTQMVEKAVFRRFKGNPNLARTLAGAQAVEEITAHPLLDLLEKDNDGLNGFQLRYMTELYLEVFGGSYWLLEPGPFEPVRRIKVLPTQRVLPIRNSDLAVLGYKYMPALTGAWIQLPKDEVIDFRFPAVEDPYGGRHAPLRSAFLQAELAAKYNLYENSLMDNRARIDGTFIPKDQLTRREAERAEQLWNEKFQRHGNGRILVAEQSGTFVPTRYPPTDLGPLEISRQALRRLANAFGVPEALLSKDATYANLQASLTLYARQTILPRVLILEQKLNERLTPRYGERLFLAADNPVPADETFELQKTQIAIHAGVLTANEIREATGYAAPGDGARYVNPNRAAEAITEGPVVPSGANGGAAAGAAWPPDANSPAGQPALPPLASPPGDQALSSRALPRPAGFSSHAPVARETKLLLAVNRAVACGHLERAIAINLLSRQLQLSATEARSLVGHPSQNADAPAPGGASIKMDGS